MASRVYQWNYISQESGPYPRRIDTLRVDYSPWPSLQTYVRINNNADDQRCYYGTTVYAGNINIPLDRLQLQQPGRGAVLHTTVTLSPTLFNEFIVGASQNQLFYRIENPQKFSRRVTGIDIPQWYPRNNPYGYLPDMSFAGVTNYANPTLATIRIPFYNANVILSFVDNVSKVAGTHTFKAGMYAERTRKVQPSTTISPRGRLAFDRDATNPLDTNHPWANALLGVYGSYAEPTSQPEGQFRLTNIEWYVQDAWRARPRLLLDYGVRFYHHGPDHDVRKLTAAFDPSLYDPKRAPVLLRPGYDSNRTRVAVDPVSGKTYSAALIGTYAPGVGDPAIGMRVAGDRSSLYTLPALKAAPRFGFSWDPAGKGRTAVRGGGGVFYDRISSGTSIRSLPNPPTMYSPTVYFGRISGLQDTANQAILAPSASMTSLFGEGKTPLTANYSFGIQQQIGATMIADISYAGSITRHQTWLRNINAVPAGARFLDRHPENADPTAPNSALQTNFLRPYQGYGDINLLEFGSTASYNGLLAGFTRRLSRGLMGGVSYTWSKALGTASTDASTVSPLQPPRQWNYGPLPYDLRHVFSARFTWKLGQPAKRFGVRKLGPLTDGWELAGIGRFSTGVPFTPGFSTVDGQDITGTPSESARMVVRDPDAPARNRFGRPARGTFGNLGINTLNRPGINNWDLSVYKQLKICERISAQLRLESYNTFNHTQFSAVSATARFDAAGNQIDPLFLEPTAARSPRRVQLALRLNW